MIFKVTIHDILQSQYYNVCFKVLLEMIIMLNMSRYFSRFCCFFMLNSICVFIIFIFSLNSIWVFIIFIFSSLILTFFVFSTSSTMEVRISKSQSCILFLHCRHQPKWASGTSRGWKGFEWCESWQCQGYNSSEALCLGWFHGDCHWKVYLAR